MFHNFKHKVVVLLFLIRHTSSVERLFTGAKFERLDYTAGAQRKFDNFRFPYPSPDLLSRTLANYTRGTMGIEAKTIKPTTFSLRMTWTFFLLNVHKEDNKFKYLSGQIMFVFFLILLYKGRSGYHVSTFILGQG